MPSIFKDFNVFAGVYCDHVVIFSWDETLHLDYLLKILETITEYRLNINFG